MKWRNFFGQQKHARRRLVLHDSAFGQLSIKASCISSV